MLIVLAVFVLKPENFIALLLKAEEKLGGGGVDFIGPFRHASYNIH
jgi:hypothetical protein